MACPIGAWAEAHGEDEGAAYNMLAYQRSKNEFKQLRDALAATLGVARAAVDWLVEGRARGAPPKTIPHKGDRRRQPRPSFTFY